MLTAAPTQAQMPKPRSEPPRRHIAKAVYPRCLTLTARAPVFVVSNRGAYQIWLAYLPESGKPLDSINFLIKMRVEQIGNSASATQIWYEILRSIQDTADQSSAPWAMNQMPHLTLPPFHSGQKHYNNGVVDNSGADLCAFFPTACPKIRTTARAKAWWPPKPAPKAHARQCIK